MKICVDDKRYIVCRIEEQVNKDRYDREAMFAGLWQQFKQVDRLLVGNRGYLKSTKGRLKIENVKILQKELYGGKWILRTTIETDKKNVVLRYKQLLQVEDIFRTMKSILDTRPYFIKVTILFWVTFLAPFGHSFCARHYRTG